jgi:signal transduction histidine kinase
MGSDGQNRIEIHTEPAAHESMQAPHDVMSRRWLPCGKALSLRLKFLFSVMGIIVSLSLALGHMFVHFTSTSLTSEIRRHGQGLAASLAERSRFYVLTRDREVLQDFVNSMVRDDDVVYAMILDADGKPLATAFSEQTAAPGGVGREPVGDSGDESLHVLEVSSPVTAERVSFNYLDGKPALPQGEASHVGTVLVGLSTERARRAVAVISHKIAVVMLLATIASLLVTLLIERRITGPVQEVSKVARAIASGELDLRVKVRSQDEVGQLAESFNHMADVLAASLHKLERYNRDLEETVARRTRELVEKKEALELANKELRKVDKLKSDFISNVSHELKTPLTSIKAIAEILQTQIDKLSPKEVQELLGIVEIQTDRLTRLINDILDLSKLESSEPSPELVAVSISAAVADAVHAVRGLADGKEVSVSTDIPEDLPAAVGEPDAVVQVLVNLLSNAVKFTPPGGSVKVSATYLDEETIYGNSPRPVQGIVVTVSDTGIGIPNDQLEAVFDKFKQLENAAWGKPSGSGLGLAISKAIVERMGGIIWAESEEGKGSAFHFTLRPAGSLKQAAAA